MTLTEWKAEKAAGRTRATFVGTLGKARYHVTILTISAFGVRARFQDTGNVERLHPDDLRPGWI